MQKIIGVRFKRAGKIYFFDPGEDPIEKGDRVIVDTPRGLECGTVVMTPRELPAAEIPSECAQPPEIKKIHRKATKADLARVAQNQENEKSAFKICLQKIAEHGLPMKLINVSYTFDVNKIIFYFTADGRVDFRELVRDLAYVFHTRIELRQVGVRDEAKQLGGTGCCGRPLCCANFLGDFAPVSIRMAKEQNLSLNPTKISGICGRLLCCLKYESEYYHERYMENFQDFRPERGDRVVLDSGEGKVVAVNFANRTATVWLDSKKKVTANWDEILPVDSKSKKTDEQDFSEENSEDAEKISKLAEDSAEAEEDLIVSAAGENELIAEQIDERERSRPSESYANPHSYGRKNNFDRRGDSNRRKNFSHAHKKPAQEKISAESVAEESDTRRKNFRSDKNFNRMRNKPHRPKDFRK